MTRLVEPEWLDGLPATDSRAAASRRDLRCINVLMRHVPLICSRLERIAWPRLPKRVVDLGAGDGTFLLRLAQRLASRWPAVEAVAVDQQNLLDTETTRGFAALGWEVTAVQADVFEWLAHPVSPDCDVILANLFLHHFAESRLRIMFEQIAARTRLFLACEPRRSWRATNLSRLLWLTGCNAVTRHDAIISVRAGFQDHELTDLWPQPERWLLREGPGWLASHCFFAQRR